MVTRTAQPIQQRWEGIPRAPRNSSVVFGAVGVTLLALGTTALARGIRWHRAVSAAVMAAGAGGIIAAIGCCCRTQRPPNAPQHQQIAAEPVRAAEAPASPKDAVLEWINQSLEREPASAETMQAKLIEARAFHRTLAEADQHQSRAVLATLAVAMAGLYKKVYGSKEAPWQFLNHMAAADEEMIGEFATMQPAASLTVAIWCLLFEKMGGHSHGSQVTHRLRGSRACEQLLDRADWPQTEAARRVRGRVLELGIRWFLIGWLSSAGSMQDEMARGLVGLMRRGSDLLWVGANIPDVLSVYQPLDAHEFLSQSMRIHEEAVACGRTSEEALLHQADCLARLLRLMRPQEALLAPARGVAIMAMSLVGMLFDQDDPTAARLKQGETGLIAEIEAMRNIES